MPWSALPEHLNSPEKWKGTDWDTWYQRWMLKYKGWFCFGPRATERWARWRDLPLTLLRIKGKGEWRYERDGTGFPIQSIRKMGDKWYLSRVQKWCTWSVQLMWPLCLIYHFPLFGGLVNGYLGFYRDADRVYWMGIFIGGVFK